MSELIKKKSADLVAQQRALEIEKMIMNNEERIGKDDLAMVGARAFQMNMAQLKIASKDLFNGRRSTTKEYQHTLYDMFGDEDGTYVADGDKTHVRLDILDKDISALPTHDSEGGYKTITSGFWGAAESQSQSQSGSQVGELLGGVGTKKSSYGINQALVFPGSTSAPVLHTEDGTTVSVREQWGGYF